MDQDEIIHAELVPDPITDDRPVRWRELLVVLAVVALADVAIYRGHGYSGYALLFIGTPLLLLLGAPVSPSSERRRHIKSLLIVTGLLLILVTKMVWCGWGLHIALGLALLWRFALALSGTIPYVLEIVVFPGT